MVYWMIRIYLFILKICLNAPGEISRVNSEISWLVKQFGRFITVMMNASLIIHPQTGCFNSISFQGRPKLMDPVKSEMPACFVVPPRQKASMICLDEPFETFIATCYPTVLSSVFGLDLAKAGNSYINLTDGSFRSLWERLSECRSAGRRIDCFTDFWNTVALSSRYRFYHDTCEKMFNNTSSPNNWRFPCEWKNHSAKVSPQGGYQSQDAC